jgi:hypothetical protein
MYLCSDCEQRKSMARDEDEDEEDEWLHARVVKGTVLEPVAHAAQQPQKLGRGAVKLMIQGQTSADAAAGPNGLGSEGVRSERRARGQSEGREVAGAAEARAKQGCDAT